MTKIKQLAEKLKIIYAKRKLQIDCLETTGPKNGSNARYIPGWTVSGNRVITQACKLAGIPLLNYWSGCFPTPSKAYPECLKEEIIKNYSELFRNGEI